jgi:hypothetical protein
VSVHLCVLFDGVYRLLFVVVVVGIRIVVILFVIIAIE